MRILWAKLQAHRVFDDIIRAEYRHNPRIAPIIVLHLLENRIAQAELEKLESTVASQATAILLHFCGFLAGLVVDCTSVGV
jgi:hypothetical protein